MPTVMVNCWHTLARYFFDRVTKFMKKVSVYLMV